MTAAGSPSLASSPDPLQMLDEARQHFVASFVTRCDSIRILVDDVAAFGRRGPVEALTEMTHRLSGLAGTIGFPTVSARASALEHLVDGASSGGFDLVLARDLVDAIRDAFATDLASPPPVWAPPAIATTQGVKILVAEDEPDQRAIVTAYLGDAGYEPIAVESGDIVVAMAHATKPAVILLDIAMPRLDGYSVCRLLKADPELADIPVIVMTSGASHDDKLAGLALGADEFLTKPVDMRELALRIQLLLRRRRLRESRSANVPYPSRELTYEAFLAVAREQLTRLPAALAIVRLPAECHQEGSLLLAEEVRGRDAIGAYGPTRLLILMPELTAGVARDRLEPVVDRMVAQGLGGTCIGVTATATGRTTTAEALIGEADEALAEARYLGHKTAIWTERARPAAVPADRTVVVAEDDPDVMRIVDAQVRAAGYKVVVAYDGEQALAAVRAHAPDVLVLDLMMPKLDGFDVLNEIRASVPPRPRTIVLSGRGREQDVVRAFDLDADDYMTKPFNPQELMARIGRLLR